MPDNATDVRFSNKFANLAKKKQKIDLEDYPSCSDKFYEIWLHNFVDDTTSQKQTIDRTWVSVGNLII